MSIAKSRRREFPAAASISTDIDQRRRARPELPFVFTPCFYVCAAFTGRYLSRLRRARDSR